MNNQLAIVVLIDVEAALKANTLHGNTYLIDNYRFRGSTGEGTEQLTTAVIGSQILNWLVAGIDLSGQQPIPVLESIGGEAVERQILVPQLFDSPALDGALGLWWGATVDANVGGKYGYTLYLDMAGRKMEFVSAIDVRPGFTMHRESARPLEGRTALAPASSPFTQVARLNPDNHVSPFSRAQLNRMRSVLNRMGR
jgi:hypothetical protein